MKDISTLNALIETASPVQEKAFCGLEALSIEDISKKIIILHAAA